MAKIPVLLVDDHIAVREGTRLLLELDQQISVVGEAGSGEEALEKLEMCGAEVVLMDIMMPGVDGIETTRQISAEHPDVKVVIFSAFGNEYLAPAIEAGATGYILKTATQSEMVLAVVQAADGQCPLDPRLVPRLFDRLAQLSSNKRGSALSSRHQNVLRLIADGMPSKEIAKNLSISRATLTRELRHVFDLLGVDDRAHAVAEAFRRKLL